MDAQYTLLQPSGQTKRWLPKRSLNEIVGAAATSTQSTFNNTLGDLESSQNSYRLLSSSDESPLVIEELLDEVGDINAPSTYPQVRLLDNQHNQSSSSPFQLSSESVGSIGSGGRSLNGIRRKQPAILSDNFNNNYGSISLNITNITGPVSPSQSPLKRKISRAVTKKGASNLTPKNIEGEGWPFLADIFTTALELSWSAILISFCFCYFASWLFFAVVWYLILYFHGDFDPENVGNPSWEPCISGFKDFTSAFLFSVETQHTTGYGFYHLTEQCAFAVMNFCAQSIFGCILEGIMVGLLFVKISRAKKRSRTLMFSRTAVINSRDGNLCFMFRLADMRKSQLLDASIRAAVISKRTTAEGEEITISTEELDVSGDGEKGNKLLLFWPTTVIHQITSSSPLYKISAADLNPDNTHFEIIVVLQGIVEATGLTTQARSSYMPHEILWGHRFQNVTSSKSKSGNRIVDYSLFHSTVTVPTSPLSAQQLDSLSFAPSVTKEQLAQLASNIVTNALRDSFKQLRSFKTFNSRAYHKVRKIYR